MAEATALAGWRLAPVWEQVRVELVRHTRKPDQEWVRMLRLPRWTARRLESAPDDPSSRRRPSHSPSRSNVQPLPLPVPRTATALRKRPQTNVRSAWSAASSENRSEPTRVHFPSALSDR